MVVGHPLLLLAIYSALLAGVGWQVTDKVPEPYMDEIFHIPQARAYCAGNYTQWNPKITTLPGLYLFSVGLLRPLHVLGNSTGVFLDLCTVPALRSVNILVGLTNLVLLHSLTRTRHGDKAGYSEDLGLWSSLNLSLMPPLFFCNLLYYTDPVSTCMVLLTYTLHLTDRDYLAAVAGLLSVFCRQTNIVWVFLAAAETAGQCLVSEVRAHQARTRHPPTISLTMSGQLTELGLGLANLASSPVLLARILGLIVLHCFGYIVVGLLFLGFLHLNQGIVVGDRSAHIATVHLLQLCYFSVFYLGLSLPWALSHIQDFFVYVRNNYIKVSMTAVALCFLVHYNTMAHPYLLADNRHFTFYLWRKVFMRHWIIKYLLIPVYLLGFYHLARCIRKSDLIFKLCIPVCLALSLVPQMLLEFRYFIIPFLLFRAQVKPQSKRNLALETCILVTVNLVTLWLFLFRPFSWESQPGVMQRFMW